MVDGLAEKIQTTLATVPSEVKATAVEEAQDISKRLERSFGGSKFLFDHSNGQLFSNRKAHELGRWMGQ